MVVLLGVAPDDGGDDRLGLAGSSHRLHLGRPAGRPPRVDLLLEQRVQQLLRRAISEGRFGDSRMVASPQHGILIASGLVLIWLWIQGCNGVCLRKVVLVSWSL